MRAARQVELSRLIDKAMAECDASYEEACQNGKDGIAACSKEAKIQFAKIKRQVIDGSLPSWNGAAGLGITRALGEFASKKLYDAGDVVEKYYMDFW